MPCYDPYAAEEKKKAHLEELRLKEEAGKLGAIVCGVIRKFGIDFVVSSIDWQETGVTEEYFRAWWKEHQKQDENRG